MFLLIISLIKSHTFKAGLTFLRCRIRPTVYQRTISVIYRDTIDLVVNIDSTGCCWLSWDVPPGHQASLRQRVR